MFINTQTLTSQYKYNGGHICHCKLGDCMGHVWDSVKPADERATWNSFLHLEHYLRGHYFLFHWWEISFCDKGTWQCSEHTEKQRHCELWMDETQLEDEKKKAHDDAGESPFQPQHRNEVLYHPCMVGKSIEWWALQSYCPDDPAPEAHSFPAPLKSLLTTTLDEQLLLVPLPLLSCAQSSRDPTNDDCANQSPNS